VLDSTGTELICTRGPLKIFLPQWGADAPMRAVIEEKDRLAAESNSVPMSID
jgi:hypothetical protein